MRQREKEIDIVPFGRSGYRMEQLIPLPGTGRPSQEINCEQLPSFSFVEKQKPTAFPIAREKRKGIKYKAKQPV